MMTAVPPKPDRTPMIIASVQKLRSHRDPSTTSSEMVGIMITMSATRMSTASIQPPK